jgi:hypothetical protein
LIELTADAPAVKWMTRKRRTFIAEPPEIGRRFATSSQWSSVIVMGYF